MFLFIKIVKQNLLKMYFNKFMINYIKWNSREILSPSQHLFKKQALLTNKINLRKELLLTLFYFKNGGFSVYFFTYLNP